MPTVVATPGASDANSYLSLTDANALLSTRPDSSPWDGANQPEREKALIAATRRIDQEEFAGAPVKPLPDRAGAGPFQALKWPRYGVRADDGWYYSQEVVPERVKRATASLALAMLAGVYPAVESGLESYESLSVDVIRITPRKDRRAATLPADVLRELRPVLRTPGSMNFRILRG